MKSFKHYKEHWHRYLQLWYCWAVYTYEHKKLPPKELLNWGQGFASKTDADHARYRLSLTVEERVELNKKACKDFETSKNLKR